MSDREFSPEHFTETVITDVRRDPDQLVRKIAARHGVTVEQMLSALRFHHLVQARLELYRTLRRWGWSLPAIGSFARRNHTTILAALRTPEEKAIRALAAKIRSSRREDPV